MSVVETQGTRPGTPGKPSGEDPLRPYDVITLWREFDGRLMPRQAEVLTMFVDGYTHQEIAEALGITAKTVEAHLLAIRDEMGFPHRRSLSSILLRTLVRRLLRPEQPTP